MVQANPSHPYSPIAGMMPNKASSRRSIVSATWLVTLAVVTFLLHQEVQSPTLVDVRNYLLRPPRPLDPYACEGYLYVNESDTHANRWYPHNAEPAPALWASVLRASWRDVPSRHESNIGGAWQDEPLGPDNRGWDDATWARNRTVLVIGDSTARNNLAYLCGMAGEQLVEIKWDHPFSPPRPGDVLGEQRDYLADTTRSRSQKPAGMPNITDSGVPDNHQAHYCYLPGVDLLAVHVFNFGLDLEGYWLWKDAYTPPYRMDDRISYLARGYMEQAAAVAGRNPSPDLVYVGSALWDSVRFQREDIGNEQPTGNPLGRERVTSYRAGVRSAVATARRVFPVSRIKWISNSYPVSAGQGYLFDNLPGKRPVQSMIRLDQLQSAARSAITELGDASQEEVGLLKEVEICPWGEMLRGYDAWQVDSLHPALLPAGYLWADILMYDLRETAKSGRR